MVKSNTKLHFETSGGKTNFTFHFPLIVFDKPKMILDLIEPAGANAFNVYDIEMFKPK